MKELQVFDALKADIATFVGPIPKLRVLDFKSSALAVDHGRTIQGLLKEIEAKRDTLVRPRNEEVKRINEYVKELRAPLDSAKRHLEVEVGAFAAEQRRIQDAERARIEAERRAKEAQIEADAQAKREALEAEAKEHSVHPIFGNLDDQEVQELEQEKAKIDEEEAKEKMGALLDAKRAEYDAGRKEVKGARMVWDCEVLDINEVPVEYLIREVNKQMVLAAARAGNVNIPGVRVFQKPSVGFGASTYVPREALRAEATRARAEASSRGSRRPPGNDVQPSRRQANSPRGGRANTSGRRS